MTAAYDKISELEPNIDLRATRSPAPPGLCQNRYLGIKRDAMGDDKDLHESRKRDLNRPNTISGIHVWLILWKAARAVEQNATNSVSALGLGLSDFAVL